MSKNKVHARMTGKEVHGYVRFFNSRNGNVMVAVLISGLEPGSTHGLHVHQNEVPASCSAGDCCAAAGGHYNPTGAPHGHWPAPCHAGDLKNNVVANSRGFLRGKFIAESLKGIPLEQLVGRSVVLHAGTDDLGLQGRSGILYADMHPGTLAQYNGKGKTTAAELATKSTKDGNAGARIACGNIV